MPYSGHTTSTTDYYACGLRQKVGKKACPCHWLKKSPLEQQIIEALKEKVIRPDLVRDSLKALYEERAQNKHEDDSEEKQIKQQLRQAKTELERMNQAILAGINPEALAEKINSRLDLQVELEKRLVDIKRERTVSEELPEITDELIDGLVAKFKTLFATQDLGAMKVLLARFIDRIDISENKMHIFYSVTTSEERFVRVIGDPRGI